MVLGFILGSAVWSLVDFFIPVLNQNLPALASWNTLIRVIVQCLGAVVFVIPAVRFIRYTAWQRELRIIIISVVIAAALVLSQLLDKDTLSGLSDLLGVATVLAALIIAAIAANRQE